jgi:hypothetical protein
MVSALKARGLLRRDESFDMGDEVMLIEREMRLRKIQAFQKLFNTPGCTQIRS